jgi:hypothetical protein
VSWGQADSVKRMMEMVKMARTMKWRGWWKMKRMKEDEKKRRELDAFCCRTQ